MSSPDHPNAVPVILIVGHNVIDALVGRRSVPLADADPGIRAALDQAITDHGGSVDGPLRSGPALLVDGRLVL